MSSWLLPADANRLVHSPHYITVEEADELPVVVMGTEATFFYANTARKSKDRSVRGYIMAGIYVVMAAPSRCQ